MLEFADTCLVHVTADEPLLIGRFERRMESPDRHAIHNDATRLDDLRAYIEQGVTNPLDLPIPRLILDTTASFPDPADVAQQVRHLLGGLHEPIEGTP